MAKNKGNYYKIKTKDYFKALGYTVEYLEKLQRIPKKGGGILYVKRDLLAADGLAVNEHEFILWNSIVGKDHLSEHIRRFQNYPCPQTVKRWVIIWQPRVSEPEIVEVEPPVTV